MNNFMLGAGESTSVVAELVRVRTEVSRLRLHATVIPALTLSTILLGIATAPLAAADGDTAESTQELVAYAWSGKPRPHVIPMYWVMDRRDVRDPSLAKAATDAMPDGHRVLFLWDFARQIDTHPQDCCRDANGNLTSIRSIWWDRGAAETAIRVDQWFGEYLRLGGRVDTVVLDYESNLSNWALGNNASRCRAIENDPRFDAIAKELGFRDLSRVIDWRSGDAHRKWNALMERRQAEYINRAIFEPMRRHFPNVRMANYGYYYNHPSFVCPDRNGYQHAEFGSGPHIGTHQSAPLYGWLGNIRRFRLQGTSLSLTGVGPEYGASPFAAFRLAVNQARSMRLSSEVPLMPWVSHKRFRESLLRDSDLHQELIFHAALTCPEALLFWNPQHQVKTQNPDHFSTPEQEQLLSDCLTEFNQLAGPGHRQPILEQLAGWGDEYVLSGMRCGDRSLWRFTPAITDGGSLASTVVRASPATLRIAGTTVTIPGGSILAANQTVSTAGLWITSRPDGNTDRR